MRGERSRSGIPAWLAPVAIPLLGALAIGAVVLYVLPGPSGEQPTGEQQASATATGRAIPSTSATSSPGQVQAPGPTPHPATRNQPSTAVRDGVLYLAGGTRGGDGLTSAWQFDQESWSALPDLPEPRAGAAAVTSDGSLLVIGGSARGQVVDSILVLEDGASQWTEATPMPNPQTDLAAAVIEDTIYVIGGSEAGTQGSLLIFDRLNDVWTTGAPVPEDVSHGAAIAAAGRIYLVGGRVQGQDLTPHAFHYDPRADEWVQLPDMPMPGDKLALATVDDAIWVVGAGQDRRGVLVLDTSTNEWRVSERRLAPNNSWHAAIPTAIPSILVLSGSSQAPGAAVIIDITAP